MANEEQLAILRQGVEMWNKWRLENLNEEIDLSQADLRGLNLDGIDLENAYLAEVNLSKAIVRNACLINANLEKANLFKADLSESTLRGANLSYSDLRQAKLHKAFLFNAFLIETDLSNADISEADFIQAGLLRANLKGANLLKCVLMSANLADANLSCATLVQASLCRANLSHTNLSNADLRDASLTRASFVGTIVTGAKVSSCEVYGISVWDLEGEFEEQRDLIITPENVPAITVDNIKVAQFIYLILNNSELRSLINTLISKTVLILGRFAIPERKAILDALRNKLREHDLLPIVFDFDRPTDKDFTETVKTLAGISYFVIADITNPKSSPLELQATVPDYQIPFVPIIQEGERPFAMMVDLQKKYPWVLPTRSYDSIETLMAALKPGIIDPAVEMRNKLRLVKAQEQVTESLKDYLDQSL